MQGSGGALLITGSTAVTQVKMNRASARKGKQQIWYEVCPSCFGRTSAEIGQSRLLCKHTHPIGVGALFSRRNNLCLCKTHNQDRGKKTRSIRKNENVYYGNY